MRSSGAGDDSHLWFGWRHGTLGGLGPAIRAVPRLGRFVSAFGAQSVPDTARWMQPERWPDLDWDDLAEHHGMERRRVRHARAAGRRQVVRRVARRDAGVPGRAAAAPDRGPPALQGRAERRLRRVLPRRPAPGGGLRLLDHERVPKRAYARGARRVPARARRWSIRAPATCTSSTTRRRAIDGAEVEVVGRRPRAALARRHRRRRGRVRRPRRSRRRGRRRGRARRTPRSAASRTATRS